MMTVSYPRIRSFLISSSEIAVFLMVVALPFLIIYMIWSGSTLQDVRLDEPYLTGFIALYVFLLFETFLAGMGLAVLRYFTGSWTAAVGLVAILLILVSGFVGVSYFALGLYKCGVGLVEYVSGFMDTDIVEAVVLLFAIIILWNLISWVLNLSRRP